MPFSAIYILYNCTECRYYHACVYCLYKCLGCATVFCPLAPPLFRPLHICLRT